MACTRRRTRRACAAKFRHRANTDPRVSRAYGGRIDVLAFVLPQRCLVCRVPGGIVCEACVAALPRIPAPLCERCGAPTAWPVSRCVECAGRRLAFASARAAVIYDDAVRGIVAGWKERGLRGVAALAAEVIVETVPRPDVAAIAFVPPDADRSLRRGHHPAERLAYELGGRWELPVERLLTRAGASRPQRGLSLQDRRRNVAGAIRPAGSAPSAVTLVDDVYTSGATANAAASALRKAGARRVEVVTFARAVR
jgi:predicted amidophosphoribosyltransferase